MGEAAINVAKKFGFGLVLKEGFKVPDWLKRQITICVFRLIDRFGHKETYFLKVTGPDYEEISILFGAFRTVRGSSVTFQVKCSPPSFRYLKSNLTLLPRVAKEMN